MSGIFRLGTRSVLKKETVNWCIKLLIASLTSDVSAQSVTGCFQFENSKKPLKVSQQSRKANWCCVNTKQRATLSALNARRRYEPSVRSQMDTLVKRTSDMEVGVKRTRSGRIVRSMTVSQSSRQPQTLLIPLQSLTLFTLTNQQKFYLIDWACVCVCVCVYRRRLCLWTTR